MTEEFFYRYRNWVRWCLTKGQRQGHVFSLEGNYRSPQNWYPEPPRPAAIDVPDAVLFNRAFTRLAELSPRHARVIKILTFRAYLRPEWQAQKLGIHHLELADAHYRAQCALFNQVSFLQKSRYHLPRYLKPLYG